MDSQGGSTEACFTRRQYLPSLSINYVAITKNITYVHDWMQTQTLQKKQIFFIAFDEFYPWHTVSQQSRVDEGVGRRVRGHPFFFEILNYFYRILRKMKSIYIAGKWASDPPLKIYENDHQSCIRQT